MEGLSPTVNSFKSNASLWFDGIEQSMCYKLPDIGDFNLMADKMNSKKKFKDLPTNTILLVVGAETTKIQSPFTNKEKDAIIMTFVDWTTEDFKNGWVGMSKNMRTVEVWGPSTYLEMYEKNVDLDYDKELYLQGAWDNYDPNKLRYPHFLMYTGQEVTKKCSQGVYKFKCANMDDWYRKNDPSDLDSVWKVSEEMMKSEIKKRGEKRKRDEEVIPYYNPKRSDYVSGRRIYEKDHFDH